MLFSLCLLKTWIAALQLAALVRDVACFVILIIVKSM